MTPKRRKPSCTRCNDTGVWETGNNDLPCPCGQGEEVVFNTVNGQRTGNQIRGRYGEVTAPETCDQCQNPMLKKGFHTCGKNHPRLKVRKDEVTMWARPNNPEETDRRNILGWYRKGWACGAGVKVIPPEFEKHSNPEAIEHFQRGWKEGRKAMHKAMEVERKRLKLPPPSVLRLLGGTPIPDLTEDDLDVAAG